MRDDVSVRWSKRASFSDSSLVSQWKVYDRKWRIEDWDLAVWSERCPFWNWESPMWSAAFWRTDNKIDLSESANSSVTHFGTSFAYSSFAVSLERNSFFSLKRYVSAIIKLMTIPLDSQQENPPRPMFSKIVFIPICS